MTVTMSSFLDASIPQLISAMSIDEKLSLLAGEDWWRTVAIPRLDIPSIKVTDGPNGARGESFFKMTPATVLPNATCLAATFSPSLAYETGQLLAKETKARNAVCLLGPTTNISRSPLGGRVFESFSEDPTLSGQLGAQYIRGLQDSGVSGCIKHFVANDQEHERMGQDAIISMRPLREVYLRPFQLVQAYARPWAYMTSYNKLNGTHCSENSWLLDTVLRKEWGFDGLVMSDWYGTYSVAESINAGLNLEMPGKARWRRPELVRQSMNAHKIRPEMLDERVSNVLRWAQKLAKLNPDLVSNHAHSPERTRWEDMAADAAVSRRIGADGIVLLKNENEVLPIRRGKVAIIGPNAKSNVITGGGSARLKPSWVVSPWEGLVSNKPDKVQLDYALGCKTAKFLPTFGPEVTAADGSPGFDIAHYAIIDGAMAPKPTVRETWNNSDIMLADFHHPDLGNEYFTEVSGVFTSPIDGEWQFEASVTGQAWMYIDDQMVLDLSKEQKRTSSFFGNGTEGTIANVPVQKGKQYQFRFLHDSRPPPLPEGTDSTPLMVVGMKLGSFPAYDEDAAIAEAVALAASSDVAVLVVGLDHDWESESYDRPTLSLPGRTDSLIDAIATSCPSTRIVVVVQAGSAISMPWIDKVDSVLYTWYLGNEAGNAIADIVYGSVNPSGRLPLTLPQRELDIPANLNFRSARTRTHYEEGIWVGYRHFNARGIAPLFPFGHGLSYTSFGYEDLRVVSPPTPSKPEEWHMVVAVDVVNTGTEPGAHSAHFYTAPPPPTRTSLLHPEHTMQAFDKTPVLRPGERHTLTVTLDKYAISHWDDLTGKWRAEPGLWRVLVGRDAQTMEVGVGFEVEEMTWSGL